MKHSTAKWLAGVYLLILAVIVLLASQPQYRPLFDLVKRVPYGDKLGHFCLMGGLSFLVNWAFKGACFRLGGWRVLKGSLLVFVLVTLEEFSQLFLRYRSFDLIDLLFDALGIFIFGQLASWWLSRPKPTHQFESSAD